VEFLETWVSIELALLNANLFGESCNAALDMLALSMDVASHISNWHPMTLTIRKCALSTHYHMTLLVCSLHTFEHESVGMCSQHFST
jgi:hypothetical protein